METRRLLFGYAFILAGMLAAQFVQAQTPPPPSPPSDGSEITNTYAAKFICGVQQDRDITHILDAQPGRYSTKINVHNNTGITITFRKKIIQLLKNPDLINERPTPPQAKKIDSLKPDEALEVVCRDIYNLVN